MMGTKLGLFVLLVLFVGVSVFAQPPTEDQTRLAEEAFEALRELKFDEAASAAEKLAASQPKSMQQTSYAADVLLRSGRIEPAIELFDETIKMRPFIKPHLWQRGIALYFDKKFDEGAEQFEIHREVNPNDVENAAWHFLCVAKSKSPREAKKLLLPAPGDPRIPMKEILQLLDDGDMDPVIERMESVDVKTSGGRSARFYGHLYLGLYADAVGDLPKARQHLKQSVEFAPKNYMGDVARVYSNHLAPTPGPSEPNASKEDPENE
ncbi:tetratricopeptide repeat protein [Roseiconus lacunae]|nr:tetratricopeptide repeat protein [Roseiconus lacunae]